MNRSNQQLVDLLNTRDYECRTRRVVRPDVIEVLMNLGLGVVVNKAISLTIPRMTTETYNTAFHCMIVMCGGKRMRFKTDPDNNEYTLTGRLFTRVADNFCPSGSLMIEGRSYVDVLDLLAIAYDEANEQFDVARITPHLNKATA